MNTYNSEQSRQSGYGYQPFGNQPYAPTVWEPVSAVPFSYPPQTGTQPEQLPMGGFKPLSKEERDEAAWRKAQEGFSWAGYQVIHKELFSHKCIVW